MTTTTLKNPNGKRHVLNMTALATRFCGWFPLADQTNMLATFVCNPLQNRHKLVERQVVYLATPQSSHSCNVERFKVDAVKPITKRMSKFEEPVPSPIRDTFVRFTQSAFCLAAIAAAFLFACQFSVTLSEFRHATPKELWTFNGGAIAASEECLEAKIKPCRVSGTSGLRLDLSLLATKHHPKSTDGIPLERAGFDSAFYLARLNELVCVLTETNFVSAEVRPASLLESDAATASGLTKLRPATLGPCTTLDPLKKRRVREVEPFNNCLDALRANDFPVFSPVANLGNVLHQSKLVAMPFEQPIVRLLKRYAVIPYTSRHGHHAVEPVPLTAFVHSEFVTESHLYVSLVFDVLLDYFERIAANGGYKVTICPESRYSASELWELLPKNTTAPAFYLFYKPMYSVLRVALNQQVNMVWHCFHFNDFTKPFSTNLVNDLLQPRFHITTNYIASVLWAPDDVILARIRDVIVRFVFH